MAKRLSSPFGSGLVPLGRLSEFINELENPDRTAYKAVGFDYAFQEWPNRPSMARTIRMQERGENFAKAWKPVLKLSDGEGC